MSRSLGVLTLDLIARTGGFEQGMDRASRRVRSTADEMEAARRTADRYVMAIGAAGVAFASAAVAMAANAAKAMDATAKMAQQIGTTTEALTGMRFAAQQFANISDQQFDQAMRRMTRRIAEAAEGSGSAKKALDAMGLSARELARLSPDKQMLAIADAMQRTERQADRLRHTMAIFDTEGMALVPALQQGAEAFEANIALARQFGVVVSQEAASAAEEFMTNMNLLTEAQKGFKNQVAESVLPMLAEFSGYLVDIAKNAGDMGERVETALKVIGVAAAATATIITSRLIASILKKVGAWGAATLAAARLQAQMTSLSAAIAGTSRVVSASAGLAAGAATVLGRAGQLALGVLGGPVGLAAMAAITGAAFLAMGRDSRTAATDVDELTRSLENLNRRQLESAAFNLENELAELSKQAEGHGQILQGLRNDYDALSKSQGVTEGELRNVRQAIREEEEAFESVIATIAKKSPLLAQITQRLLDLDTATRGATGSTDALNRAMGHSEAGEKYLAQIQGRIKALQDSGDPIKIASRYIAEHTELTEADRVAIMSAAHAEKALIAARNAAAKATKAGTNALNEAKRAAEAFRREQEQGLRAQLQAVSAIHQQAGALEDQVLLFGQSKTAIEDLTIARLEEQAAMLRGFDGSQEQVEAIEREIEARRRLRTAIGSLEQKEAERQAWEDWARDVEQIFDRVGQSLTDAIFDGGKSGKDLLRDMFKGLTFNILINPIMKSLQGMVTQQLGGLFGVQQPGAGGGILGMAQNANTLYQAYSGGMASNLGQGIQWIGNKIGSQALQSFATGLTGAAGAAGTVAGITSVGAGLGASLGASIGTSTAAMASTSFSAALSGGAGTSMAATAGASGAAGAGAAFGAALPWIGGALAIGSLLGGSFGNAPETRFGGGFHYQPGDTTAAYFGGPSGRDAGAENVIASMITDTAQSLQSIFDAIGSDVLVGVHGSAESSGKGRGGTASGGDLYIDGEIIASFGTIGKGTGFGGTSGSLEEMIQNLGVDLTHTFLEGLQAGAAFLPSTIQGMLDGIVPSDLNAEQAVAVAQHIQLVIEQVGAFQLAVESLPFATLRDLSFDAAANLISFAGGLENLDAGMTSYFQNFYSEAEQLDWATQQIGAAFDELGLTMPDVTQGADAAKAAYRSLVESLDVTTEEGQRAYATLMTLSGGFAELVTGLEGLNDSVGALRERESLERQWLALIGDETELRRRDLALLHESNREMQERIWAEQEAQAVIARAQEAARAVEQERYGLEAQLLQLQGDTVALRARELDALNPLNRGLQQQIWTLQDAAAAQQAYERSIQSVTGSLAGIRETVLLDQLGSDDARYDYFKQQADGLARLLPQLTDESAITQTISQIASITGRAYGLLDDEQKQSMGGEFLDYIDRTETIATRQIQAIQEGQRQAAQEQAEATAKAVAHEVGRIANAIIKSVEGMPASTANAIRNAVAQNTGQRTTQYREVEFAEVNA